MLAIDTSSARSAVALVDGERVAGEVVKPSGRDFDVAAEVVRLAPDLRVVDSVLVALGPGSFTGLRQGIAFGVGLALSLRVPLLGIGTLDLVAARAREPAVAVSDAGRGRVYFQAPDGRRGVAEAADVPSEWPAVGWLRRDLPRMLDDSHVRSFGEAVVISREGAKQVGYGTVRPEYMQQFGRLV
ncbi:MAG: tRNA (adenosine(37)-N6)-threonylcarbamoyltransferase complex dimerization subunit type 1 TsaB [Candidatus Dormibacteraeota bacterium]|nr:tRNA (adenosine(37)-N6)-threonylcarbamoyltransferase complex dimerization subunit type 1 TsaB [Candidatus Dormibacteraeota bacterium]